MKSSIFPHVTLGSPVKVKWRFEGTYRLHLHVGFRAWFTFWSWRWRWYVLPKRRLTFTGLPRYYIPGHVDSSPSMNCLPLLSRDQVSHPYKTIDTGIYETDRSGALTTLYTYIREVLVSNPSWVTGWLRFFMCLPGPSSQMIEQHLE
jgi:hypothetical protein